MEAFFSQSVSLKSFDIFLPRVGHPYSFAEILSNIESLCAIKMFD